MKFQVSRASIDNEYYLNKDLYGDDYPFLNPLPCEGAKKEICFNPYWKKDIEIWTIELNTLEDLERFIKENGKIIIDDDLLITIYDDDVE